MNDRLPVASAGQTVAFLRRELRRRWRLTVAMLVAATGGAAASLVAVLLLGRIVDAVQDGADRDILVTVAIAAAVAAVVTAVLSGLSETLLAVLIARLLASMRERVVAAVLSLPVATIERAGRGDTLSRVGTDVAVLVTGARTALPTIFSSSVLIAVSAAGMFALDWRLALAGLTAVPMYVLAMRWYLPRSSPKYRAQRVAEAEHVENLVAGVDGLTTLRAYGLTSRHRERVDESAHRVRDISVSAFRILARFVGRENRAEFTGLSAIVVVGWLLLRADAVTLGQVSAATLLFHRLFNPIGAILMFFDEAQRSGAALTRIVGVIDAAGRASDPATIEVVREPVAVQARNVRHAYAGSDLVVDGVDLDIAPGSSLALVGASGAGKTTIASLLGGTLAAHAGSDGQPGSIRYNGTDIATLSEPEIRRYTSVATQEGHVFSGTLGADLRLARPGADDETLWAALSLVGADRWIRALDDGLDTRVGVDGYDLDPMKVQQIALARLLLRDAPVVILDESTAEAGSRGAAALENAAAEVIRDRTALVVAHRLSQAAMADRIAVVDRGRVVESGSHADLVAAGGYYATLWRAWSETHVTENHTDDDTDDDHPADGRGEGERG
ncbi:ABC transporter ATP-binding protein [Gordonia sinesedis]